MLHNELSEEIYKTRYQPTECNPYSSNDKGIRAPFYRDITAIVHSVPFRTLKRKTQVFFAPEDDQICTRIEHVLHVLTNSTTVSQELIKQGATGLELHMVQAIALGHDVGHSPFGHAGETVLNEIMQKDGMSFHHELHGLRCVDYLAENRCGLQLTFGVRDGIVHHCGEKSSRTVQPDWHDNLEGIQEAGERNPASYEGCIVRIIDKISSLGRDMEDALILSDKKKLHAYNPITNEEMKYRDWMMSELNAELISFGLTEKGILIEKEFNRSCLNHFLTDMVEYSIANGEIGLSEEKYELFDRINNTAIPRQN